MCGGGGGSREGDGGGGGEVPGPIPSHRLPADLRRLAAWLCRLKWDTPSSRRPTGSTSSDRRVGQDPANGHQSIMRNGTRLAEPLRPST